MLGAWVRPVVALSCLAAIGTFAVKEVLTVEIEADRTVAEAVAGYLSLVVPHERDGRYAPSPLLATVNLVQAATYWHAGLQTGYRGTLLLPEAPIPSHDSVTVPLRDSKGVDSVGWVRVWDVAPWTGYTPTEYGIGLAALLATLAASGPWAGRRSKHWFRWRTVFAIVLVGGLGYRLTELARSYARSATEGALGRVGSLAAIAALHPDVRVEDLGRLGPRVQMRFEAQRSRAPDEIAWRTLLDGREEVAVEVPLRTGGVAELGLELSRLAVTRLGREAGAAWALFGVALLVSWRPSRGRGPAPRTLGETE